MHEIWRKVAAQLPRGGLLAEDVWQARHRAFLVFLWLESLGLFAFGVVRGYNPFHALAEAGAVAVLAVFATVVHGRGLKSAFATTGLLTASAILVHLSGGTIEAHFHFFVVVTLVTLYQEWWPFALAIGYVVLHHGLVGLIDPTSVYNHPAAIQKPFLWASIHGVFVLAASAAGLVVWKRNEDLRLRERAQALELHDKVVQGLVAAKMSIEVDQVPKAEKLIRETLGEAQGLVSDLLRHTAGSKDWEPGDFVRNGAKTISGERTPTP